VGSDEAGGFAVAMPGAALCGAAGTPLFKGLLKARSCTVETTGLLPERSFADYDVSWFELPGELRGRDPSALLRENAKLRAYERQQMSLHPALLGGAEGLEVQYSPPADELRRRGAIWRRLRECVHQGRFYEISVVYYQAGGSGGGDPGGSVERTWKRMVDSFHFDVPGEGVRRIALGSSAGSRPRTIPRPPWATGPEFSPPAPPSTSQRHP
jgi:hypothetical protein